MTDQPEALRAANVARAKAIFENFAPLDADWIAALHPDVVMEFPFGADVGLPARVAGKEQCVGLFQLVAHKLGLRFSDIEVLAMADPELVLARYKGEGMFGDKPYRQDYLTLMGFKDGQLILYREHVDTVVVQKLFGHLSALM